jgi:hypothetical protein
LFFNGDNDLLTSKVEKVVRRGSVDPVLHPLLHNTTPLTKQQIRAPYPKGFPQFMLLRNPAVPIPQKLSKSPSPAVSVRDRITVIILGIIKIEGTGKGVAWATRLGMTALIIAALKMLLPLFH